MRLYGVKHTAVKKVCLSYDLGYRVFRVTLAGGACSTSRAYLRAPSLGSFRGQ